MLTLGDLFLILLTIATPFALLWLPRVCAAVRKHRSDLRPSLVDHIREAAADDEVGAAALISHIEDVIRRTSPPPREIAQAAHLLEWEDRLPEAVALAELALMLSPEGEDVVGPAARILRRAGQAERAARLIARSAAVRGLTCTEYGVLLSLRHDELR